MENDLVAGFKARHLCVNQCSQSLLGVKLDSRHGLLHVLQVKQCELALVEAFDLHDDPYSLG